MLSCLHRAAAGVAPPLWSKNKVWNAVSTGYRRPGFQMLCYGVWDLKMGGTDELWEVGLDTIRVSKEQVRRWRMIVRGIYRDRTKRVGIKCIISFVEQVRPQSQLQMEGGFTENKETYIAFWGKRAFREFCKAFLSVLVLGKVPLGCFSPPFLDFLSPPILCLTALPGLPSFPYSPTALPRPFSTSYFK